MADIISGVLLVLGAGFVALAGIGVIRFPDLYARMHAATKASTLGIALVSLAGAVALDDGRSKILLAAVAIFITGPVGAHFVGRAAYRAEGVELRLEAEDELADRLDDPDPT